MSLLILTGIITARTRFIKYNQPLLSYYMCTDTYRQRLHSLRPISTSSTKKLSNMSKGLWVMMSSPYQLTTSSTNSDVRVQRIMGSGVIITPPREFGRLSRWCCRVQKVRKYDLVVESHSTT